MRQSHCSGRNLLHASVPVSCVWCLHHVGKHMPDLSVVVAACVINAKESTSTYLSASLRFGLGCGENLAAVEACTPTALMEACTSIQLSHPVHKNKALCILCTNAWHTVLPGTDQVAKLMRYNVT